MASTFFKLYQRLWIAAISLCIVLTFFSLNYSDLSKGTFIIRDEYTTLDRSLTMHKKKEYLQVYSENLPSFRKPPMHYWLSSVAISLGLPLNLSARLPSFVFGLGAIILTGMIAFLVYGRSLLIIPLAMILTASNYSLVQSSKLAMLDTGMLFFFLLTIYSLLKFIENPKYWILVALSCALGALQKTPWSYFIFLASATLLYYQCHTRQIQIPYQNFNRKLLITILLATCLISIWPLLQWNQYGLGALRQAYLEEIVDRFIPITEQREGKTASFHHFFLEGDFIFRLPGLLCLFALPLLLKKKELYFLPLSVILYGLLISVAPGKIFPRYSLIFIPLFAVAISVVMIKYVKTKSVLIILLSGILIHNYFEYRPSWKESRFDDELINPSKEFKKLSSFDIPTVLCDWRLGDVRRIHPGIFSLHGSTDTPFYALKAPQDLLILKNSGVIAREVQGLCTDAQLRQLETDLEPIIKIKTVGHYIIWRAQIRGSTK